MSELMIILGAPASGKTTLARRLAADLALPLLCKDDIKEALFDVLGAADRDTSKRWSDASFAAQLRMANTQCEAELSCILEGNWRAEHSAELESLAARSRARTAQVRSHARPGELARRFSARIRHPGHLDADLPAAEIAERSRSGCTFLDLAGARFTYDSEDAADYPRLLCELKIWRL